MHHECACLVANRISQIFLVSIKCHTYQGRIIISSEAQFFFDKVIGLCLTQT